MYEVKGENTCVQPAAQHRPKCYAAAGEKTTPRGPSTLGGRDGWTRTSE